MTQQSEISREGQGFDRYTLAGMRAASTYHEACRALGIALDDARIWKHEAEQRSETAIQFNLDRCDALVKVSQLTEALRKIAQSLDCGCVPCTGQCRSAFALEIELEERQDIARAAIAKAQGTSHD